MKKRYVKIMFLSMALLVISTAATYAVQPKDEPKETVQTPTDEHLPSLTINGTNESSSFFVDSKALPGKEITITAPFLCKCKRIWNGASCKRDCCISCLYERK